MFGDVLRRKQSFVHLKKLMLYSNKTGDFPKGLTHNFGQKYENCFIVCFKL